MIWRCLAESTEAYEDIDTAFKLDADLCTLVSRYHAIMRTCKQAREEFLRVNWGEALEPHHCFIVVISERNDRGSGSKVLFENGSRKDARVHENGGALEKRSAAISGYIFADDFLNWPLLPSIYPTLDAI